MMRRPMALVFFVLLLLLVTQHIRAYSASDQPTNRSQRTTTQLITEKCASSTTD